MGTEIDGHVGIGHDERVGVVRAAERAFADGIAAELIARQRSIVERQFHGVAAAVVDLVAESESAAAVGGDAADVVHGLVAGEGNGLNGNLIVSRDGARGLALGGAEGLGIVDASVVGAGRPVAGEGGSVGDGVVVGLRGKERVSDGERAAVVIAHEAGAEGGGGGAGADYLAVEDATANGECAATRTAYDASVCAVALDLTFDDGADKAVLNVNHTPATAYKTTAIFARALDGASHLQVADGGGGVVRVAGVGLGSGYVAEWGGVIMAVVGAEFDVERIATAVEGAGEVVLTAARHASDGVICRADISFQLHCLASEVALRIVFQYVAEDVPARDGPDGVRAVAVVNEMRGVGGAGKRHGCMTRPHTDDACEVGLAVGGGDWLAVHGQQAVFEHGDIHLGRRRATGKASCRDAGQAAGEGDCAVEVIKRATPYAGESYGKTDARQMQAVVECISPDMGHAAPDGGRGNIFVVCCPWHVGLRGVVGHGTCAADGELLVVAILVVAVQGVGDAGAARACPVSVVDAKLLRQGSRVVALSGGGQRGDAPIHVVGATHGVVGPSFEHLPVYGQRDVGHDGTARIDLIGDVGNGAGSDVNQCLVAQRGCDGDVGVAHGEHTFVADRCTGVGGRNGEYGSVAVRIVAGIAQLRGGIREVVVAVLSVEASRGGRAGQSDIVAEGHLIDAAADVAGGTVMFFTDAGGDVARAYVKIAVGDMGAVRGFADEGTVVYCAVARDVKRRTDDEAVLDSGARSVADESAAIELSGGNIVCCGDTGAIEDDVPEGAIHDVAEKAGLILNIEAADEMVATIVDAPELTVCWREGAAAAAEVDVGGLYEALTITLVPRVDISGKGAEVGTCVYLVEQAVFILVHLEVMVTQRLGTFHEITDLPGAGITAFARNDDGVCAVGPAVAAPCQGVVRVFVSTVPSTAVTTGSGLIS